MNAVRAVRSLRAWFDEVLDADATARAVLLQAARGQDPALAEQLQRLLAQHERHLHSVTRQAAGALGDDAALGAPPIAQVGPWRLGEELGRGGMGRVFAAVRDDGAVRQEVALKLVRRDLLDERLLRRFSTERQLLAALEHPGLCRLIDTGELPDGTPYVVMERVRGQPLLEHCDAGHADLRKRLLLFQGVLDAVAYAHRNLVVHRDIKPGNVMVDEQGRTKLLDFGIAKRLEPGELAHTLTTDRAFTLSYAAPEQIRGGAVGIGVDVYGLGALLYELLAGAPPFPSGRASPGELERRILEQPPPPMSDTVAAGDVDRAHARGLRTPAELKRALRGDLDLIVQRCLRKSHEERYASVDLLQLDLQRFLDGQPISGRLAERGYRLRRFVGRHRLAVTIGAVSGLLLVTAAGAIVQQSFDLRRQRDELTLERDRAEQAAGFLRDAFLEADPARNAGVEVTARQILDAADARLHALRTAQPDLHAALATTIGSVRLALGDVSGALRLAREANTHDPGPEAETLLIRSLFEAGEWREAERLLGPPGPAEAAERALVRAQLEVQRSDFDAAIARLRPLVKQTAARPVDDILRNEVSSRLIDAYRAAKRTPEAVAEADRLLATQLGELSPAHPLVQRTQAQRVTLLTRLNRYEEALALAEELVRQVGGKYGTSGTAYANALMTLGMAQGNMEQTDRALETTRRAVEAWKSALGPTHSRTLRAQLNVAGLLWSDGDTQAEAIELLAETLRGAEHQLAPEDTLTMYFRRLLATWRLELGDPGGALAALTGSAAEAGLARSDASVRTAHLQLAAKAALRLGCAPHAGAETPEPDACPDYASLRRFEQDSTSRH